MSRLLIILLIIAVIAIILYLRREQQARAAEQQRLESSRRLQEGARVAERAPIAAASTVSESAAAASGRLQEAADRAAGVGFERATEKMEGMTADLAEARRDADLTAARLSSKAYDALAAVQAAAAAHGGAVPGDGTSTCPPGFPVKGVVSSMLFHEASSPGDDRTFADVCFQSAAAAEAAGFLSASRAEAVVVEEIAAIDVDATAGQAEVIVADAVLIRDRENGERADIVADAIAAADAGGVPPGAIRGDGGRDCPPTYAIKGNRSSMLYHEPGTPTYESTVPEFCFSSVESATAAGFSATRF